MSVMTDPNCLLPFVIVLMFFGGFIKSSNSMFGAVGPSNFLGKLTAFIAALFLVLNLAQAVLLKNANTEVLFTDEEIQEATKITEILLEFNESRLREAETIAGNMSILFYFLFV